MLQQWQSTYAVAQKRGSLQLLSTCAHVCICICREQTTGSPAVRPRPRRVEHHPDPTNLCGSTTIRLPRSLCPNQPARRSMLNFRTTAAHVISNLDWRSKRLPQCVNKPPRRDRCAAQPACLRCTDVQICAKAMGQSPRARVAHRRTSALPPLCRSSSARCEDA